jgi:transposase
MRDTDLYRYLLSIEAPWTVARVELDVKQQRVDVWTEHRRGVRWPCPECGAELATYDHADERAWRHMDSCHFKTYLHARPPRVHCPKHGVKQVRLPWAEPNSRFTAMFERLVIDVLKETDVLGATRILDLSWDEAWGVMQRAVARGLLAKQDRIVEKIGVDEKSAAKGHKYITLVYNLDTATVEYIGDERKTETLDGYYRTLSKEQLAGIEAIAMDMWDPYIKSTKAHVPGAEDKIVFDRFHIMQHMGKAVDTVRKQEHRALKADGDERLTGTKYIWLYSQENLPDKYVDRFEELRATDLKTARAWAIKENLRHLWTYQRLGWAEKHWRQWYYWATHSRLKPVVEAARTIERHLQNVMTFFKHRITNAVSEGMNSKIQTIKKRAYGYRNRDNFKTAIYFHCGGLQLYPPQATHSLAG